jgi:hypothetical protein
MKKIIIATALLLSIGFTQAQDVQKIRFGIKAGANMQTFNGKDEDGRTLEFGLVPRFNAGFNVDIPVATDFYLQTGLMFSTKGAKNTAPHNGNIRNENWNLSYIELPINFLYKPLVGTGRIMIGFGPYIAYGIGGKRKTTINNIEIERKIEFESEYTDINDNDIHVFKPIDFGANLFFGYEFRGGFNVMLNTQLGLSRINAKNNSFVSDRRAYKNTGFGLTLGYNFN